MQFSPKPHTGLRSITTWLIALFSISNVAIPTLADAPATQPASNPAERLAVAKEAYELAIQRYASGLIGFDVAAQWAGRLAEAGRDGSFSKQEQMSHLQRYVDATRQLELLTLKIFDAGIATRLDVLTAKYLRLQAVQWLQDATAR